MFVLLFWVFANTYAAGTQKRPGLCARTSWRPLKPHTFPRLPVPTSSRATARSPSGARVADLLLPPVVAVCSTGYSPLSPLVNAFSTGSVRSQLLTEPASPRATSRGLPSASGTQDPGRRRSKPLQTRDTTLYRACVRRVLSLSATHLSKVNDNRENMF